MAKFDQAIELTRLAPGIGGEKAQRLAWLNRNGYRTPDGLVVPPGIVDVRKAVEKWVDAETRYVVRSSAAREDGLSHTFAGQLDSVLDIRGLDAVVDAVIRVRGSGTSERLDAYRAGGVGEVACIIQPMIDSVVGGVVFTRNPVTGLDELIVEAVVGRSSQVLADGLEPHRWIHRWGEYVASPVETEIDRPVITAVVEGARTISATFGKPLDLEWVWDGERLWWVQLRPIGGLDVTVYSNRIAREVLPGAIKPLVWSLNVPLVNGAWIRLLDEATGPTGLAVDDLAKRFACHAYFNMTAIGDIFAHMGMPRDSLELLLGLPEGPDRPSMKPSVQTIRLLPKMLSFAARRGRAAEQTKRLLQAAPARLAWIVDLDVRRAGDRQLWEAVRYLDRTVGEIAEANIVVPLLFNFWAALLHRRSPGEDPLELALDDELTAELAEHDPQAWLKRLVEEGASAEARHRFIQRFGHLSDSGNDISTPTWAEQPDVVDKLLTAAAVSPDPPERRTWDEYLAGLARGERLLVARLGRQAHRYRILREAVGSLYTYAYGLYRPIFLELGQRLVSRAVVDAVDDVFYLTRDEVADPPDDAKARVVIRRAELAESLTTQLPETIFGDDFVPATPPDQLAGVLRGTAAARGRYTGPVKVITSVSQIDALRPGDVLVVPFSDVGWTPLFGQAGAVVAESGGLLSHSSIVAREYGVPCVVSVLGATRLADGTMVTVDGSRGEVEIHA